MTSKSQYEKKLNAFAPYYYDDENHIDSRADGIDMTNVKITKWKHGTNKNKMSPTFRHCISRNFRQRFFKK